MEQGPPQGVERRRHPRYDLLAQVRVKHGQIDYVVELDNISLSGARLKLGTLKKPAWLVADRAIEIVIVHPVDLDTVDVKGKVVRVEEDSNGTTAGVVFDNVGEETAAGLERLVATARRGPPPLPKG